MRKINKIIVILTLSTLLIGCENSSSKTKTNPVASQSKMITGKSDDSKVLIAYFSRIGNIDDKNKVDVSSSASVVTNKDDVFGNMEYIANLIKNVTRGDLHFIETSKKYSSEYDESDDNALDVQAIKENRENARPELATHIDNINNYDVVFLGFPNWYGDMPMAVYSFLDEYDLSNKKIYLFNSSGGSGARNAYAKVSDLQPNAMVEKNVFSVSHSQVSKLTNKDIQDWIEAIDYEQ